MDIIVAATTAVGDWLLVWWPWLASGVVVLALFGTLIWLLWWQLPKRQAERGRRVVLWMAGIIVALLLLIAFLEGGGAVLVWAWLSTAWHWYSAEAISSTGTVTHPNANLVNPVGTFIGALGAFLAAATLAWAAIRNARATTRQAKTASDSHDAQTEADRQRRIIESYSKAVEQLSSDKIEQRLGGIYTLERISRESPNDYWTIMETLTAFVRERAHWKEPSIGASETMARFYESDQPTR